MNRLAYGFSISTLALSLSACNMAASKKNYDYPQDYMDAQTRHGGETSAIDTGLERFSETFAELTAPELEQRVAQLYADQFYFNDTFKTLRTREELVAYLTATGERLQYSEVNIQQVMRQDSDVYIKWHMRFGFRVGGRDVESNSIGITHVRFNQQGQIILHQDFWDGAHGFYRHMPVVGGLVEWLRGRL